MEKKQNKICLITGTRKGIGRYLAEYYLARDMQVIGCSRSQVNLSHAKYLHYTADVSDEKTVKNIFSTLRKKFGRLDVLINNAGIAAMNHALLTPLDTAKRLMNTNFLGTFLFCREAARLMQKRRYGRIVNFTTVATPLKLEGEAVYASSKAAVISLTEILARELAEFGITVNAIGPTPVKTDLIRAVPQEKIKKLIKGQAIHRLGEFRDISNVIDFFIQPTSDFITGQVLFLGGI